jgi:hypothetical protein
VTDDRYRCTWVAGSWTLPPCWYCHNPFTNERWVVQRPGLRRAAYFHPACAQALGLDVPPREDTP